MAASLSDRAWLARFGFRVGADGYLAELDPSRCADWLTGFLAERGGAAPGADVYAAAAAAGWCTSTLKRARPLVGVTAARQRQDDGRGRRTVWALPPAAAAAAAALPARAAIGAAARSRGAA